MRRIIACVVIGLLLTSGKLEAAVVIPSARHVTEITEFGAGGYAGQVSTSTDIPLSGTISATVSVPGSGSFTAAAQLSRSQTLFDYTFSQQRPPSLYTQAVNRGYDLITVTNPTSYSVSGAYVLTGLGRLSLLCQIYDTTALQSVYYNYQRSDSTLNQVFELGLTAGDAENHLTGSQSGWLEPGHTYQFTYEAMTASYPSATAASAEGNLAIAFGSAAVPEPSACAVWTLLGAVGWGIGRRRRVVRK